MENKQYYQLLYLLNAICTLSDIKPGYVETLQLSIRLHQIVYVNEER